MLAIQTQGTTSTEPSLSQVLKESWTAIIIVAVDVVTFVFEPLNQLHHHSISLAVIGVKSLILACNRGKYTSYSLYVYHLVGNSFTILIALLFYLLHTKKLYSEHCYTIKAYQCTAASYTYIHSDCLRERTPSYPT